MKPKIAKWKKPQDCVKKLEIGTLYYPSDIPDLDRNSIVKAIYREVDRQLREKNIASENETWR